MSTSDSCHRQKIHCDLLQPLPGQGTEQGNCSTLSFDGSSPHNAFSTGLDVAETDASCTTQVRLRTCNPSPHCPPYGMMKGNRGFSRWQKKHSWFYMKSLQILQICSATVPPVMRRQMEISVYLSTEAWRQGQGHTWKWVIIKGVEEDTFLKD